MSDNFTYQLNIALPPSEQYAKGHLVNVRADNAADFLDQLRNLSDATFAAEVAGAAVAVENAYRVVKGLGATPVATPPPAQAPQAPPQAPAQPQQQGNPGGGQYAPQAPAQQPQGGIPTEAPPWVGPAPQCSHGQKRFLAKPYKNGKPGYWMAWSCPAQRGDQTQHDLEFIQQKQG